MVINYRALTRYMDVSYAASHERESSLLLQCIVSIPWVLIIGYLNYSVLHNPHSASEQILAFSYACRYLLHFLHSVVLWAILLRFIHRRDHATGFCNHYSKLKIRSWASITLLYSWSFQLRQDMHRKTLISTLVVRIILTLYVGVLISLWLFLFY
jgi:hypothetical protein